MAQTVPLGRLGAAPDGPDVGPQWHPQRHRAARPAARAPDDRLGPSDAVPP